MTAMSNKIEKTLQSFDDRFARWVIAHRWTTIVATVILAGCFAAGVLLLTLSTDYRIFFDKANPQLQALESLEDTYGKADNVLFMLASDHGDAFSEQMLSATVWLTENAWQTPYSTRVDSLSNFQHTTADEDTLVVNDLVGTDELSDSTEQARIREIALSDPRLVGRLLATDGSVSGVLVTIALAQEEQTIGVPTIAQFAYDLAARTEQNFPGITVRTVGTIMINHAFSQAAIDSQKIFLPLSLIIMAVVLILLIRDLTSVMVTGFVMILSIAVAMGLGGWIGLPFSPPVAPAPTIILMIVVANSVHLLVTMRQFLMRGESKQEAIQQSVRINLYPIFLASVTTALGFLAMNFSEVPPHRHLGTYVAFGIISSFILSVTFLPAALSLLPVRKPKATTDDNVLMTMIAKFVIHRQKPLLFGSLVIVLALTAVIPRNELNDVLAHFFDKKVEFRQDLDFLDDRLSGNTVLEYSLHSRENIAQPQFLADVAGFADWYRAQPDVRNVSVITDTFRQINKTMHADDPNAYRLPEHRDLASQYLLLYELSLPAGLDLNNQISFDKVSTRVSVATVTLSSRQVLELDHQARQWLADNTSNIVNAESSGPALLFAYLGQRNIKSMLTGTAIVLLSISIILLLAFRSIRLGLISLVPNFVPALVGFGIWGLTVGEVGTSLSVVVAMTIGIVVDDTVHFLSKYRRARLEMNMSVEQAITYAFETVGQAIVTTTTVLVAGFLILLFAPFVPTAQVGLLTALIIASALVFDFFLLPPLLMAIERFSSNRKTA